MLAPHSPDNACKAVIEGLPINALQARRSHSWIHPRNLHAQTSNVTPTFMLLFQIVFRNDMPPWLPRLVVITFTMTVSPGAGTVALHLLL